MKGKTFSPGQEFRTPAVATLIIMVLMVAGALLAVYPVKFSLVFVVGALLAVLATRYPETIFALFLTAGLYKGPPVFRLPSVDLTIFLGLSTVFGILWGIIRKRVKLTAPPFRMYAPFLAISCLSALSLTYTMAPVYGFEKLSRFVTLTTFAFFAPLYLFQEKERYRNFLVTYVAGALGMLFYLFHQGWLNPEVEEVVGYNYLFMGYSMAVVFLMTLMYLFFTDSSPIRRVFYVAALCPAAIYGLMITGARGPFISLLITLIIVLVLSRQPHRESSRFRFWVMMALVIGGLYFGYEYQNFARMTKRMMEFGGGGGASALERVYMAKAALNVMSTMPYTFTGLGVGGFSVYYSGFDGIKGEYPHNMLLELGTEIGIAGLAAGILLIAWSFRKAFLVVKNSTGKDYYRAVSAASVLLFAFLNTLKSGDLNDHRLFFAMTGLIFALDAGTGKHSIEGKDS